MPTIVVFFFYRLRFQRQVPIPITLCIDTVCIANDKGVQVVSGAEWLIKHKVTYSNR